MTTRPTPPLSAPARRPPCVPAFLCDRLVQQLQDAIIAAHADNQHIVLRQVGALEIRGRLAAADAGKPGNCPAEGRRTAPPRRRACLARLAPEPLQAGLGTALCLNEGHDDLGRRFDPLTRRQVQHRGVFARLPPIGRDHQLGDHRIERTSLGRAHPLLGREVRQHLMIVADGGGELGEATDRAIQPQVGPHPGGFPTGESRAAFAILLLQCRTPTPAHLEDIQILSLRERGCLGGAGFRPGTGLCHAAPCHGRGLGEVVA